MNLHAVVRGPISAINPDVTGTLRVSTGYTIGPGARQVPSYSDSTVTIQEQPLSTSDLKHLDALNIQGVTRAAYLFGDVQGLVRKDSRGGDLLIWGAKVWLVAAVIETWAQDNWCKVGLTLQKDAA